MRDDLTDVSGDLDPADDTLRDKVADENVAPLPVDSDNPQDKSNITDHKTDADTLVADAAMGKEGEGNVKRGVGPDRSDPVNPQNADDQREPLFSDDKADKSKSPKKAGDK